MIMMRGEGIFSFSFLLVAQIFKTKYVLIDIVRKRQIKQCIEK